MRPALPALLALAAILASAGGAAAQEVPSTPASTTSLTLAVRPSDPIPPGTGSVSVPIQVEYTHFGGLPTVEPTEIVLAIASAPPWVEAVLSPATLYVAVDGACPCQDTAQVETFLVLSARHDAPAFHTALVTVEARAAPNGHLGASESTLDVPVAAGFLGLLDAAFAVPGARLEPAHGVLVPMTVSNDGNGLTKVHFEVVSAPEGVHVVPPAPVVLESPLNPGARTEATVQWQMGAAGRFAPGEVVVRLASAYALNPAIAGAELVLRLPVASDGAPEARQEGLSFQGADGASKNVPGPGEALALAALGGVALLARRRPGA